MYSAEERKRIRETDPFLNVNDQFRGMPVDQIKEEMSKRASDLVVIAENLVGDFNVSQIIRTSNWFASNTIVIAGRRHVDMRGAVGTQNYMDIWKVPTSEEAINEYKSQGYRIVSAEITDTAVPMKSYAWHEKTALVLGEEGKGITQQALDMSDDVVYIEGRGTVRSLNVAGAYGIMTYDYHSKMGYMS